MKYEVGNIIRDDLGTRWVIIKRTPYQASAHNDRWTDYTTELLKVSKYGGVTKQHRRFTTDDSMRGFEVVGNANITFTVDVSNIKMEK